MSDREYRTFGVGKFHTYPWSEDLGYDTYSFSEKLYGDRAKRQCDAYALFIAEEHPAHNCVEGLKGERTEMYYMPQMSPMPAEVTVEVWAADRAVEQVQRTDAEPYFGFVFLSAPTHH